MNRRTAVPTRFITVLLLLAAFFLRTYLLDAAPPGLTHDEADHGLTALQILDGAREIYFTVGYGREPLFDYAAAGLMALLGANYWVGRLTAVFFSMLTLAGMIAWSRLAFDRRTALLTAAGLAAGFWPLMSARQMLRSITLPALFVLALLCFWRAARARGGNGRWGWTLAAGLLLGLSFYTYIPARGLWLLFPLLLGYLAVVRRDWIPQWAPATVLMLLLAALLGLPLAWYLQQNPAAEVRIDELSAPLQLALQGEWGPLRANMRGGLGIFTFIGDTAWRYNLPGRPLLPPLLGLLFYVGLGTAVWGAVRPLRKGHAAGKENLAAFTALVWLALGLAPVLVTGAELSGTQAIGLQPVLYLFPALALVWLGNMLPQRAVWALPAVVVLLYGGTAVTTARAYFAEWAAHPQVRVQYESSMTAAVRHLAAAGAQNGAVSTITPGPYHSPALAQMVIGDAAAGLRWFDGRGGLLLPAGDGLIVDSGFAPLALPLADLLEVPATETISLPETDLDQPLRVFPFDAAVVDGRLAAAMQTVEPASFAGTAVLRGFQLQPATPQAGDVMQVLSWWEATAVGPTDLRLFTHFVGADGVLLAQADRLDVPGTSWQPGDQFLQLHTFTLPEDLPAGPYFLHTGMYRCLDEACTQSTRFLLDGSGADFWRLTELEVTE